MNKQQTFRISYENLRLPKLSPYCDVTCMVINPNWFCKVFSCHFGMEINVEPKASGPIKSRSLNRPQALRQFRWLLHFEIVCLEVQNAHERH